MHFFVKVAWALTPHSQNWRGSCTLCSPLLLRLWPGYRPGRQPVRRATCFRSHISGGEIDAHFPLPKTEKPKSKCHKNPSRKFWENGVLVTSCFAIFGSKMEMFDDCYVKFWSKTQSKNAKRRTIKRFTKWPSQKFDIFRFLPQNSKFLFLKIIAYKNQNFQVIKITEYI